MCRRRTTLPARNRAVSRHHRSDGTMSATNLRHRHGAAPDHVFRGRHHGGPIPARGMVALSLPLPLRWAVAAGQEDLVEVLPREVSGLTVTVAEVFRDMAAVSATARRTSNQLSVTRKLRHVRASMQSSAQVVVEAEVADATCAGHQSSGSHQIISTNYYSGSIDKIERMANTETT